MKFAVLAHAVPALLVIVLAACAPTPAPVSVPATLTAAAATAVVPPTATTEPTAVPPTATPTTEPSATSAPATGKVFSFNGVQVTIPESVASGASGQIVAAAQGADLPEFARNPAYTEIKLTGYPAQNEHFQGMIQVFPVAEYEQMSQAAGQRVADMQALLAQKPAAPDKSIPVLPIYNAGQIFRAQVQYVDFQSGAGVRFVTLFAQAYMPVTNKEAFYTYQGLTSDHAYWVSAILPVNAAFLPADQSSAGNPPAGGIAFPDPATATGAQITAYYQAVTEKLNATPAGEFTPGLDALDAMMQSLRVTAP